MATGLRVMINDRKNFTPEQAAKHDRVCRYTEMVVNTVEFKNMVESGTYSYSRSMTGEEIYMLIMSGAEILSPAPDREIDVSVELYFKNNSTVGYTYEHTEWTHLNNKFFGSYDVGEAAGNLFHEWLHKLGFDHPAKDGYERRSSVPYQIGYMVRDLIHALDNGRVLTPIGDYTEVIPLPIKQKKYVCKRIWWKPWAKTCWYE